MIPRSNSPRAWHPGSDSFRWQQWTCLGLLPATLLVAALAATQFLVTLLLIVLFALFADALGARLRGSSARLTLADFSAPTLALMLGLLLPAQVPLWLGISGAGFGLLITKQVFGGHGEYLFQPLAAAYLFSQLAFPELSGPSIIDSLTGTVASGVDATSLVTGAVLVGAVPLLLVRAVDWRIPTLMLIVVGLSNLVSRSVETVPGSGIQAALVPQPSLLLIALFVATDPVVSPSTATGRCLFALLIALPVAMNGWADQPIKLLAMVLLANLFSALIDLVCQPRIFGHSKRPPAFRDQSSHE